MLMAAFERGFEPEMVCFESWYSGLENLKLVRALSWCFLTRLKENRLVNPQGKGRVSASKLEISEAGKVVWLTGFGLVKVFRLIDTNGNAEHWATNKLEMSDSEHIKYASYSWQIE